MGRQNGAMLIYTLLCLFALSALLQWLVERNHVQQRAINRQLEQFEIQFAVERIATEFEYYAQRHSCQNIPSAVVEYHDEVKLGPRKYSYSVEVNRHCDEAPMVIIKVIMRGKWLEIQLIDNWTLGGGSN